MEIRAMHRNCKKAYLSSSKITAIHLKTSRFIKVAALIFLLTDILFISVSSRSKMVDIIDPVSKFPSFYNN